MSEAKHLCVISKFTMGEHSVRSIQANSSWSTNPYEDYAIIPDDMVDAIMETCGFCDIVLNEDGTEVVSFTALPIPEIPEPEYVPTDIEILYEIEADQELRICCLEMGITPDEFV